MEEEIEDLIGEMSYSESVKSVAISNQCSLEFTDGSERNMSSGKGTYVLEWDSEDSDANFKLHESASIRNLHEIPRAGSHAYCIIQPEVSSKAAGRSQHRCTVIAHETCTQTSKTIIELAENACGTRRVLEVNTLETQTSFVSVTGHKGLSCGLEASSEIDISQDSDSGIIKKKPSLLDLTCTDFVLESSGGSSSKFQPVSDLSNESTKESDNTGKQNEPSDDKYEIRYGNNSDYDSLLYSDIDEDSLIDYSDKFAKSPIVSCIQALNQPNNTVDSVGDKSIEPPIKPAVTKYNKDQGDTKDYSCIENSIKTSQIVAELEKKTINTCEVVAKPPIHNLKHHEPEMRTFGTLSTLSEESTKQESLVDITPTNTIANTIQLADTIKPKVEKDEIVFTNKTGMKVKVFKDHPIEKTKDSFKLPSIQNQSCPNSPHLNSLFEKSKKLNKAGTLPCLPEAIQKESADRWEITNKGLASGEGKLITGQKGNVTMQLPPIHVEGPKANIATDQMQATANSEPPPSEQHDTISISDKIKQLKMENKQRRKSFANDRKKTRTRSSSPGSTSSPDPDNRLNDAADRGCESLCVELIRKLRSNSWIEVMKTLDELPKAMSKFWDVITETRIVDLIRQVNAQIESPRTQVVRSACATVASILKNTNYTKKPDFYETVTVLLTKTGSYSRPVRRAANIALDEIVCNVDLSHAVTALCIHGCSHKSPLVRCASARLLIVCCAVSGGGRDLLRARPTSAASARRLALQSLSTLLDDRNPETRKYAERLYGLLRHLSNFEAYYLTDVDVELASRQMQKYDQLLKVGPRAAMDSSR